MNLTKFKIERISASNGGKTAVLTLSVGITVFGIEGAKRNVYYIGGITADSLKSHKVGDTLEANLAEYWQVKRPYFVKERNTWVLCNWLHSKIQYPDGVPQEPHPAEYVAWQAARQQPATVAA